NPTYHTEPEPRPRVQPHPPRRAKPCGRFCPHKTCKIRCECCAWHFEYLATVNQRKLFRHQTTWFDYSLLKTPLPLQGTNAPIHVPAGYCSCPGPAFATFLFGGASAS